MSSDRANGITISPKRVPFVHTQIISYTRKSFHTHLQSNVAFRTHENHFIFFWGGAQILRVEGQVRVYDQLAPLQQRGHNRAHTPPPSSPAGSVCSSLIAPRKTNSAQYCAGESLFICGRSSFVIFLRSSSTSVPTLGTAISGPMSHTRSCTLCTSRCCHSTL